MQDDHAGAGHQSASASECLRTFDLPDGRTMTVRHIDPADAPGLAELYDGLSLDDRYHRFFSGSMPKDFAEQWTHAADQGGVGLVVVANGDEHIVAEAGYALLPNGDGELAITVAREWRGWLGPFLLDALVHEAADRGVPNLEAEILVDNGAMLALVRSRGYAIVDHGDWSSVHVTIGTAGYPPDWPEADERPRVLVETPGGRWRAASTPGTSGLQIIGCPGPARSQHGCPALEGRPCPLAAHADVIVFAFPPSNAEAQAILSAHTRLHEGVPLVVAPAASAEALVIPPAATTVAACTPAAELIALVSKLARHHRDTADAPGEASGASRRSAPEVPDRRDVG
jgi:GNAT superfamily N-acetyltransferase